MLISSLRARRIVNKVRDNSDRVNKGIKQLTRRILASGVALTVFFISISLYIFGRSASMHIWVGITYYAISVTSLSQLLAFSHAANVNGEQRAEATTIDVRSECSSSTAPSSSSSSTSTVSSSTVS